jgi:Lon protease-like protein
VGALLPLFPLEVVLFPGVPLPLHIFEPRYKEMIGECLSLERQFGVVRAQESGVAEIGCTAEIMAVTKKYDDGRMDIVTEGRERFEVLEVNQERDFLRADVLFFDDDPEKSTAEEIAQAIKLHGEIMGLIGAQQTLSGDDNSRLSFRLAGSLPLDLDFKQNLLSMRSEPKRMQAVTSYFEAILPRLRRAVHVRKKASGNGHAQ